MKKITAIITAFFALLVSSRFLIAFASNDVCPPGYENLCKIDVGNNPNIFGNVVNVLIIIAVILSVCFLVWGGIKWIMSGGDKGKVEQARSTIIGAVVGLVIAFLAYFIVSVLLYMFTGSSMNLPIPKLV